MFTPPFQTLFVQARIDELQRVAQSANRGHSEARHSEATRVPSVVTRAIARFRHAGRLVVAEATASHRVELVGHSVPATSSRQS
jgi:hypothetical protein